MTKERQGRLLVLTNDFGSVEAVLERLRAAGVDVEGAQVDPIDVWVMRYVSAYPRLSGWHPPDGLSLYEAAANLLRSKAVNSVIQASYRAFVVDDYQSLTPAQRELIGQLTDVLGEPA